MSQPMKVDSGVAFDTGHAVMAHAVDLREELDRLSRDWDDLSQEWAGGAASAFTAAWQDWHEGAIKLVASLLNSAEELCQGAVAYEQQDASAAQAVNAPGSGVQS